MINQPITPNDISLMCKRIGNKVIVEIVGGYQAFSRNVLIGFSYDNPIIYASNCIRFIAGDGTLLAVGYAAVESNTEIYVHFDKELTGNGHIRGSFSYYI